MADSLINTAPIEFEKGDFQADLAQSVGTRDARAGGMTIDRAMLKGFQSRQTTKDPLYDLRVLEYRSRISENAAQAANYSRQLLIKNAEIVAEQRDRNLLTRLSLKYKGKPKEALQALSETNVESVWGLKAMNEQRQAITTLMDMDTVESTWSKASVYQRAKAINFEKGSQEWWDAIGIPDSANNDPGELEGVEVIMPDGTKLQALRNSQGKGYTVVPRKGDAETAIAEKETAKNISRLESDARELEKKYMSSNAEYVKAMTGKKIEGTTEKAIKNKADYFRAQQMEKMRQVEALRTPAAATNAPSASAPASKIVIQNGQRFQVNADGTSTHLGPAQ